MKVFTVTETVFKTDTLFILACSHHALDRYLRKRFRFDAGEDVGQCGQMFTFPRGHTTPPFRVVWAERLELPVVLHEVFHLVTRICADKGVPISAHIDNGESGDEAAAYLFECFARAVVRNVRQWNKEGARDVIHT